jgi:hypothetical protein
LTVILVMLALGATFLVLRSLNASTTRADRYRVSQDVLIQAKEALIARAVTDDPTSRPGSLPCPDTDDDGSAELFVGNACPSYIGRLPWRTLGLPARQIRPAIRPPARLIAERVEQRLELPGPTVRAAATFRHTALERVVALIIAPGSAAGARAPERFRRGEIHR